MRDAQGNWTRTAPVPVELFDSVRGLNHRFLELVVTASSDWCPVPRAGQPARLVEQLATLSPTQRQAAAACPYALFDLRFDSDAYWRLRLGQSRPATVADGAFGHDAVVDFARLVLFFAWHVAATGKPAPQLLLGMSPSTAAGFRRVTIDSLNALAPIEAANLSARWSACGAYWSALTRAAARPNSKALRRIQLYGFQLTAADCLTESSMHELRPTPREV